MTIKKIGVFQSRLLASAIAMGAASQSTAASFNIGEIEGSFDSTLSVGSSWALRGPSPDFINNANTLGLRGEAASRTSDDNRKNFKKGETFSKIFKGIHDLELKYGESGAFVRGKYWYDFELKDEHRRFYDIEDSGRDRAAKSSGAMFLDAFVYHNYNINDLSGNVRLGKQVVSWGESTFIGNSINSINPIDVSALRRPGSEVKEGLIPVNMFYLSQGISENINLELFYQIEWEKTVMDNCGTFFGSDPLPQGCNDRLVFAGLDLPPGVSDNIGPPDANTDVYMPRGKDKDARDSGQYGLAMRWFVPELNDTEFGAYLMNYHSRNPYLSLTQTTNTQPFTGASTLAKVRSAQYYVDYPEDIRLYGLSFQTSLGGTSVGGEVSFRPNMPLQINTADLNIAALNQLAAAGLPASPLFVSGDRNPTPGGDLPGYKRMPVFQAQVSATHFIDQVLGASRLSLIGEVGYNHIGGLGPADGTDVRFGRSPVWGAGELIDPSICVGSNVGKPDASNPQQQCNSNGFYTSHSWGYRARAALSYSNVIAGINLTPNLAWSHDVQGYGPNFEQGNKAISIGVDADYASTYTASLSYTDYFGGDFNTNTDRDYLALSFGVNF